MKNLSEGFILVKEGFFTVFVAGLFSSAILLFSDSLVYQFAAVLFFLAISYLFRDITPNIEHFEEASIVSVCDGIVSDIETIECKGNIGGECLKITLTNRLIDGGILRVPFSSCLALSETQRGMQLSFLSDKALALNEQSKVMFQDSKNKDHKIVVKHYVNGPNTPISIYCELNAKVDASSSYGFMLRGTVFMFLPTNTRLDIKKGDELKSGESLIGFFSH